MAEAGYPAAREYAEEEGHNCSATSFCCPSGQWPELFLLKSHRSTSVPWCKRDTAYCYWLLLSCCGYVVMHQYTDKSAKERKTGRWTENIILIICGGDGWRGDICCICHGIMILNTDYCSGVFLSAEWFCIRLQNGILKIQLWNLPGLISGTAVFTDTPGKMGLLAVYTGTVFILSLPLSMIYILSVIIKRLSVR